jgi:hypothetical protein
MSSAIKELNRLYSEVAHPHNMLRGQAQEAIAEFRKHWPLVLSELGRRRAVVDALWRSLGLPESEWCARLDTGEAMDVSLSPDWHAHDLLNVNHSHAKGNELHFHRPTIFYDGQERIPIEI